MICYLGLRKNKKAMNYTRYSNLAHRHVPSPKTAGPSRRWLLKAIVLLLVALPVGLLTFKINTHVKAADHQAVLAAKVQKQSQLEVFRKAANGVIAANPGITFSIAAIDLNSGASQDLGTSDSMEAASVAKLLTAALFLHQTETGQDSLNEQFGGASASYQLQQLIQQSDDNAWALFNDYLGHSALLTYSRQIGLASYDPDTNTITASDVALFLEKLYQGKLLSRSHTSLLLSFMQNTNYEGFITPAVPTGDTIYHKVGLVDDNVNDAAIITHGRQAFALVIFTDGHGTEDWATRASLMQKIARSAISGYLD